LLISYILKDGTVIAQIKKKEKLRIKIFAENIFAQKSKILQKTTILASEKGCFSVKSLIFEQNLLSQIFLSAKILSFTVLIDLVDFLQHVQIIILLYLDNKCIIECPFQGPPTSPSLENFR
jgi:hypothetical protein